MDFKDINLGNLVYNAPKKFKNHQVATIVYTDVDDDGEETLVPLEIVSPPLKVVSDLTFSENRCYVCLELDESHRDFTEFFSEIDDKNIRVVFKNSISWFGKSIPLDVVDNYYKPYVKPSRRPQIKVHIPHRNGEIEINGAREALVKGKFVRCTMRYEGIKFLKQQFSNVWSAVDIEAIGDEDEIEYNFGGDEVDDFMFNELNATIQRAFDNANQDLAGRSVRSEPMGRSVYTGGVETESEPDVSEQMQQKDEYQKGSDDFHEANTYQGQVVEVEPVAEQVVEPVVERIVEPEAVTVEDKMVEHEPKQVTVSEQVSEYANPTDEDAEASEENDFNTNFLNSILASLARGSRTEDISKGQKVTAEKQLKKRKKIIVGRRVKVVQQ